MRLRIAIGHALWYIGPESAAIEPIFARALEIAERIGAAAVRTQALWGLWASCRCRAEYPAALEMARRFADVAESTGDVGAMHLADRILGLTHHFLGQQPTAREFTQRALRHAHHLDSSLGLGYQVETPVAMAAQLARILWLQASNRRLASRESATRRSEGVIPRSLGESNRMLSWRGAADSAAGAGEFLMLLLLDDGRIVPGASSETALGQQLMQLSQRR